MKNVYYNNFDCAHKSDIGKVRLRNEDRVFIDPEIGFFGISDGMGGLRYGERTAEVVVHSVSEAVRLFLEETSHNISPREAEEKLIDVVEGVSDSIFELNNMIGGHEFGATISCLLLINDSAVFCNVGDSRGYLLRCGVLHLHTEDHNYANHSVMRSDGVERKPVPSTPSFLNSILTKFMGMKDVEPHTQVVKVEDGDVILLCSDGLHNMLTDREITKIIELNGSAEDIADTLITAANEAGGQDNISVVVVKIGPSII